MGRLGKKWVEICIAGSLPLTVGAQTPFAASGDSASQPTQSNVAGVPSVDMITLRALGPGAPLRHGNVIPGSERVSLDGRILIPGVDYGMDNGTGVVYLKIPQRAGQILTVNYRYDSKATSTPNSGLVGAPNFKYSILPGSFTMMMGLGMTERAANGSVISSNTFGFNNNFSMGSRGKLSGLFVVGDREQNNVQSGLSMEMGGPTGTADPASGHSQFLVQQFRSSLMGGTAQFDYQDISNNFASFQTVKDAGYAEADVNRFASEKGLKRMGMAFDGLKFGGLGLSDSYRNISDGSNNIIWQTMGMTTSAFKINWNSRRIDKDFKRFADIGEGDKAQLMQEAGMSRSSLAGEFAQKVGKLSFNSINIADDASKKGIHRNEMAFDGSKYSFAYGTQDVDQNFTRMGNLVGAEQAQYGREVGLHRQWMKMQSSMFGAATPVTFSQSILQNPTSKFLAQDISAKGRTWSLDHIGRKVDVGFGSLNAMQDPEIAGHVSSIASMYGQNVAINGNDRNLFFAGQGIDRQYTHFTTEPFKNWKVNFSDLNLKGQQDTGKLQTATAENKNSSFSYRHEQLGAKFNEATHLMSFEQQRLGTVAGLDRTDINAHMSFGSSNLTVNRMAADAVGGTAQRTSVAFQGKKIEFSASAREVSPAFSVASQLVDSEKDMLASLTGFQQHDAKLKWEMSPSMKLDAYLMDANNATTGEKRLLRNTVFDWSPNKKTQINFTRLEQKSNDPLSVLFANLTQQMSISEDFGKYGTLHLLDERQMFDGSNNAQSSFHKEFLAFETKLTTTTSVRTEQSRTQYDNGDKEDINTNTISTNLTKRTGVSVSDTKIDRGGDTRDEVKRNYGFWVDLGNGLKVSYGYARQLTGEDAGTMTSSLTVGKNAAQINPDQVGSMQAGQLGNVNIGGGYGVNQWETGDTTRTQAFSNFSVNTAKPFRFGLLSDVKLGFGLDTAADYSAWLREKKLAQFSGKFGSNSLAYEYKSQMDPSGLRGIDRTFKFDTDMSDKKILRASIFYKVRTLPNNSQVMIRNYNVSAHPTKNLEISNQVVTNPEIPNTGVLLGSVPQAAESNKWRADYKSNPNLTIGASWEELLNSQIGSTSHTGGVNLKLFEKNGSPITLFYGLEEATVGTGQLSRLTQRYTLQFDQHPGANQSLSLFLGNISYQNALTSQVGRDNWTARLDYQFRF